MPVLVIVMIIGFTAMAVLIIRKSNRPQASRRRREPSLDWTDDSLDAGSTSLLGATALTSSDLFTTSEPIHDWASDAGHARSDPPVLAQQVDAAAMCVEEPADLSQNGVVACDVGSNSDTGSSGDGSSSSSSD